MQEVWRSSPQKEISLMAESQIWQHWDGIMEVAYRILYSRALKMSDVSNENIYIWGTAVGWSDGSVRIRVSSSALFVVRPGNDNDRPNLEGECTRSSGCPSVSREVSLTPLPLLCLHIINLPGANAGLTHDPPLFTAVPVTSSLIFSVVAAYLQTAGLKSTVANQTGLWEAVASLITGERAQRWFTAPPMRSNVMAAGWSWSSRGAWDQFPD